MGLAASQARFLAITSRKANCEFQSMEIAQQKLSVTRDMQTATNNYQSKLNATMLVWDESGTGQGENPLQLTYDLMMTPSIANGYDPYLLTDKSGRIVLNGKMAEAAKKISPEGRAVSRSTADYKIFLEALSSTGYIASSMKDKIVGASARNYSPSAGLGGKLLDKTAAKAVTINTLTDILSDEQYSVNIQNIFSGDKFEVQYNEKGEKATLIWDDTGNAVAGNVMSITKNGSVISKEEREALTLGDLLSGQYTLMMALPDDHTGRGGYIPGVVTNYGDKQSLLYQIASMLGMGSGNQGLVTDLASQKAMEFAYQRTAAMFSQAKATTLGDPNSTGNSYKAVKNTAKEYNGFVNTAHGNLNKHENSHIGVSLTNMVSTLLTYYAAALDGYNPNYNISNKAKDSNYVTNDTSYYYITTNEEGVTEKDLLMTDFYNMLYNNICAYGWTTNTSVDDPDYLSHALKNGQLFISSLANDGRYYQGAYTENGYVVEVKDEDAIAEAELEYTNLKAKLDFKEERLELDMKNLDLEISSLTTEYDTVKNLLGKNVEKIFTMFST